MPDLLFPNLAAGQCIAGKPPYLPLAQQSKMQLGSNCLEGGWLLSIQSVKQPEIGLIFKVGFTGT